LATEIESSSTVFRLPRSHWHCQLENFTWEVVHPPSLQTHLMKFLNEAAEGHAPHLILIGNPGSGKTHLSVAAYRWMVLRLGTLLATWLNVPVFCDRVKATYTEGEIDLFDDFTDAHRFVVLDDLFGRSLTVHEAEQIVTRLLDITYQNNAALLITMNQDLKELSARLHRHEVSRLLAQATVIPLQVEQDWRLRPR